MRTFCVASNWERELIEGLAKYPEVKWVFAKLQTDIIGGGRSSFTLPEISRQQAEEYIRYVHSKGIKFNYLFNASCLGNIEFTKKGRARIIKELDWAVYKANVDSITISTNYLFKLIKKNYPKIKIWMGIFIQARDLEQFKYFDDAGADMLTVPHTFMKYYTFLEKLRRVVRCNLQILVNDVEGYWCPNTVFHINAFSHMSQKNNLSKKLWVDPWNWGCVKSIIEKPEELIKSNWVRPEDLSIYERMGYKHFKIVDRGRSTPWLLRVVRAYVDRKYEGNIFDILKLGIIPGREDACKKVSKEFCNYFLKNYDSRKEWLKIYFGKYKEGLPCFYNRDLKNFANYFWKHKCNLTNCYECTYCKKVAKAISFKNPKARKDLIRILENSIDAFLHNELFQSKESSEKNLKICRAL